MATFFCVRMKNFRWKRFPKDNSSVIIYPREKDFSRLWGEFSVGWLSARKEKYSRVSFAIISAACSGFEADITWSRLYIINIYVLCIYALIYICAFIYITHGACGDDKKMPRYRTIHRTLFILILWIFFGSHSNWMHDISIIPIVKGLRISLRIVNLTRLSESDLYKFFIQIRCEDIEL